MNVLNKPDVFVGVLGLGAAQMASLYLASAPKLNELRSQPVKSDEGRQALMDVDIMVGGTTLIIGGVASLVMRSTLPLAMMGGVVALIALWHHMVLNSPTIKEIL